MCVAYVLVSMCVCRCACMWMHVYICIHQYEGQRSVSHTHFFLTPVLSFNLKPIYLTWLDPHSCNFPDPFEVHFGFRKGTPSYPAPQSCELSTRSRCDTGYLIIYISRDPYISYERIQVARSPLFVIKRNLNFYSHWYRSLRCRVFYIFPRCDFFNNKFTIV